MTAKPASRLKYEESRLLVYMLGLPWLLGCLGPDHEPSHLGDSRIGSDLQRDLMCFIFVSVELSAGWRRMTTDYDPIAEQYQRSKQLPWRIHLECHTLCQLLGDISGQRVVDLACGEGFYTRLLRQRGAERVVGIDLSAGMIRLASSQEAVQGLGIDYRVADARSPGLAPEHDTVVAAYLLNYARSADELQAMCQGVASCLKPGGRFVTVNCNPALHFPTSPSFRPYGFETYVVGDFVEGAPIRWRIHLEDGPFEIENYYLSVATHEAALRAAGFRDITWHAPRLAPGAADSHPNEFWRDFLSHPPVTFLEAAL